MNGTSDVCEELLPTRNSSQTEDTSLSDENIDAHIIISISGVGCLGAILVLWAIIRSPRLRKQTEYQLLANLELHLILLTAIQMCRYIILPKMSIRHQYCSAWQSLSIAIVFDLTFAQVSLCGERYIFIIHALRYEQMFSSSAKRSLIATSWMLAIITWPILYWSSQNHNAGFSCEVKCIISKNFPSYIRFGTGLLLAVELALCVFFIYKIYKTASYQNEAINKQKNRGTEESKSILKHYKNFAIINGVITGFFAVAGINSMIDALTSSQPHWLKIMVNITALTTICSSGLCFGLIKKKIRRYWLSFCCPRLKSANTEKKELNKIVVVARDAPEEQANDRHPHVRTKLNVITYTQYDKVYHIE